MVFVSSIVVLATLSRLVQGERSIFDVELEDVQLLAEERIANKETVVDTTGVPAPSVLVNAQEHMTISRAMQFLANGWIILRNVIPGLRHDALTEAARLAYSRRVQAYVEYAHGYVRQQFGYNCADFAAQCPLADAGKTELEAAAALLRRVDCCAKRARNASDAGSKVAALPYFQALHVHRESDLLNAIATSPDLGRVAAVLLQTPSVRLYQTNIVAKEPGILNQETGIHRDLLQVPLDPGFGGYITFWCPLERRVDGAKDSLLHFYQGSHRDVSLHVWHDYRNFESKQAEIANLRYIQVHADHLDRGDCTAHHGWLLHRAPPQRSRRASTKSNRRAITFSYIDAEARILHDIHGNSTRNFRPVTLEDELSFRDWFPDPDDEHETEVMRVIDHPLLPIVYDERAEHARKLTSSSGRA